MQKVVENMDVAEIKKVLGRVIVDYRRQVSEMKKERESLKRKKEEEWVKDFTEIKKYLKQRDRTWREGQVRVKDEVKEERGKLNRKWKVNTKRNTKVRRRDSERKYNVIQEVVRGNRNIHRRRPYVDREEKKR